MMSRTAEYALRAIVYLAQNEEDWPISGRVIAEETGVPSKYLSAVFGQLVRQGVLDATRGKRGGFWMAKSAAKTKLLPVVLPFEPDLSGNRMQCPFGNLQCGDPNPCAGHDRWKRVKDAYLSFLTDTSVRDVAFKKDATSVTVRGAAGKKTARKKPAATKRRTAKRKSKRA